MTAFFEWQICNDLKVVDTISQMCWAINSTFIEYLINWVDSNQLIVFKISICCIDGRNDLGKTSSNPLVPLLICQSLRVCNFKANAHAIRQGPFWMKNHLGFFSRPLKSPPNKFGRNISHETFYAKLTQLLNCSANKFWEYHFLFCWNMGPFIKDILNQRGGGLPKYDFT